MNGSWYQVVIPIIALGEFASTVASLLTPYLLKKGKEAVQSIGNDAFAKTEEFLETLRKKWFNDKDSSDTLKKYEEKPETQDAFKGTLEEKMKNNPELVEYAKNFVGNTGPQLIVNFEAGTVDDSTIARIKSIASGNVKIDMKADVLRGKSVGLDIGNIGR